MRLPTVLSLGQACRSTSAQIVVDNLKQAMVRVTSTV